MPASVTAFADAEVEDTLRAAVTDGSNRLFIPAGALWGARDIAKMADRGGSLLLVVLLLLMPVTQIWSTRGGMVMGWHQMANLLDFEHDFFYL